MEYVLLLVGFILLIKGADFFVEGSSSLAQILKAVSYTHLCRRYYFHPSFPYKCA